MIEQVKNAGVVGAGGAGFPTHIKLNCKVDTVIANGVECEPLLGNDKYLMTHYADAILAGLQLVREQTGAKRAVIAVKDKYHDIIDYLHEHIGKSQIELFQMRDYYPAGDEFEVIYEVTKRVVPAGGLPINVGTLVQNVETLYNIAQAMEEIPVTRRHLTIAGDVEEPFVVDVPIGMKAGEVYSKVYGSDDISGKKVITGGVMMGKIYDSLDFPITKTTGALLLFPAEHHIILQRTRRISNVVQQAMAFCTQCTKCSDACPRDLLGHTVKPHLSMRRVASGLRYKGIPSVNAYACSECGICDLYACPMGLYPRRVNQELKGVMREDGVPNQLIDEDFKPRPLREASKIPSFNLKKRLQLLAYDREIHNFKKLETDSVELPLKQHIGVAGKVVTKAGQKVKPGDVLTSITTEQTGAVIHAPIAGKIAEVNSKIIKIIQ